MAVKRFAALLAAVIGSTCFYNFSYGAAGTTRKDTAVSETANTYIEMGNNLRLTPYKNLKNEGQISSDLIITENLGSAVQPVYVEFGGTSGSAIVLKDKSVLYNDFGEEKAAFVHIMNTSTGEKTLLYNVGEKIQIGELGSGEKAVFKICGELNVNADWEVGDYLSMSIKISVGEDMETKGGKAEKENNEAYVPADSESSQDKTVPSEENTDNDSASDVTNTDNNGGSQNAGVSGGDENNGDVPEKPGNETDNPTEGSGDNTEVSDNETDNPTEGSEVPAEDSDGNSEETNAGSDSTEDFNDSSESNESGDSDGSDGYDSGSDDSNDSDGSDSEDSVSSDSEQMGV